MKLPNFFILGGPKTGTTAMAHYLAEHPQVFMSAPKEIHFFNTDHKHRDVTEFDAYVSLFHNAQEWHRVICEASVWYLYSREAVKNIENNIDRPKYLVMIRNPIDMAYALHEQKVFSGLEDRQCFAEAWALQGERRQGRKIPPFTREPKHLLYQEVCSLGAQLQAVYREVPSERVHVIFHEDLKASARSVWLGLQAFLNIDDDGRTEFPSVNAAKERRAQWLANATAAFGVVRERIGIKPLGTGLFKSLSRMNSRERPRPAMSDRTRTALSKAFATDIALLSELTGRDLTKWRT